MNLAEILYSQFERKLIILKLIKSCRFWTAIVKRNTLLSLGYAISSIYHFNKLFFQFLSLIKTLSISQP